MVKRNKKKMKKGKKIILWTVISILLIIIAYFGIAESIIYKGNKLIEGNEVGDIFGIAYCYNNQIRVNDIDSNGDGINTKTIKNDCRWGFVPELKRLVTFTDTWTKRSIYRNEDPLPQLKQFDFISMNVNSARPGKQIKYNGKDAYCVSNDKKIYGIHSLQTINAGRFGWVDTNWILKDNACCNLGERNGNNLCNNYEWIYSLECQPNTNQKCSSGDVWSYDSCGNKESIVDNCDYGCEGNTCKSKPIEKQTYYDSNNNCDAINIFPQEKTSNDYNTLQKCMENLLIVEPEVKIYYTFKNNDCFENQMFVFEKTSNDYSTLAECENKVIIDNPKDNKTNGDANGNTPEPFNPIFYLIPLIILSMVAFIIYKVVKKNK